MTAAPTLLHVFSTFKVGGPQVRFAQIANRFGRSFRHRLLAMDGAYDCRSRLDPDLDFELLEVPIATGRTLANVRSFRRTLQTLRPDLLVTYNWGAIEWAMANWRGKTRHLHIEDGFGPEEATGQLRRRVWTRRLFLRQSTVALPSQTLIRLATDEWRIDPSRLRYVPNGIDCTRFVRASATSSRPPLPWTGSEPVIGTVAAIRREKNLGRLLCAVREVAREIPCRLVIVGDGPESAALKSLSAALGMTELVHFTGHVAEPEIYYPLFDMFALSSDTEQMPYSVIEAMAAGLPLAATAVGDVADMVAAENRPFVVAPDDDAFAGSLRSLLRDAALRKQIGKANRAKAERDYDESAMFAAYQTLFLGQTSGPRWLADRAHATG